VPISVHISCSNRSIDVVGSIVVTGGGDGCFKIWDVVVRLFRPARACLLAHSRCLERPVHKVYYGARWNCSSRCTDSWRGNLLRQRKAGVGVHDANSDAGACVCADEYAAASTLHGNMVKQSSNLCSAKFVTLCEQCAADLRWLCRRGDSRLEEWHLQRSLPGTHWRGGRVSVRELEA
jgi:hypothetical protein